MAFSFTKFDDRWCVRVWDGPTGLEDQTVTVCTRAGDEKSVKLGELLQHDRKSQIYEIAPEPKPTTGPQQQLMPLVPDGRYAVKLGSDEWELFRVWRGTRDPNVQHLYAVKGTEKGERVRGQKELTAILAIAADPGQAALDFGHCTGHCSRCGGELEVNLSRKLGVGPVCMKHWFDDETRHARTAAARADLRAEGLDPAAKHDKMAA